MSGVLRYFAVVGIAALVGLSPAWPAFSVQQQSTVQPNAQQAEDEEDDFDAPEMHAYLPIHNPLSRDGRSRSLKQDLMRVDLEKELIGRVSTTDAPDPMVQRTYKLMEAALARNDAAKRADAAVNHFKKPAQKFSANAKDALNFLTYYRGFGPSSEAGDVLLEEQLKLKSLSSAEFVRQKHVDDTELAMAQSVMQVATAFGVTDAASREEILRRGLERLAASVGEDEAKRTLELASRWSKKVRVPESVFKSKTWDPDVQEEKLRVVEEAATKNDPVIKKVRQKLKRYNGRSKAMMAASHVIEGVLGIASLTPNIAGPAAVAALTAFEMSTGGPEQDKLIKEIYLYKRIESRNKVLSKKAQMALQNYQLGLVNHNPTQVAFAEAIIEELSGADVVKKVFGVSVLNN